MDEYLAEFHRQAKVEGYGLDVTQHMPCPWCCYPDFMLLRPAAGIAPGDDRATVQEEMATEHRCVRCGRSGKNLIERDEGGVKFEFVQTGGPPPPEWLEPPPRRVE